MSKKVMMFSSKACGPCATLKPMLIEQQKKRGFELEIYTLEETPTIFQKYMIRSVPVLMVQEDHVEFGRLTGATTEKALQDNLDKWGV